MVWRLYRADPVPAIAPSAELDSTALYSYLRNIPINRFPAAHSCARRFFVCTGVTSEEMGAE